MKSEVAKAYGRLGVTQAGQILRTAIRQLTDVSGPRRLGSEYDQHPDGHNKQSQIILTSYNT